jgi:hypothetical protein
MAKMRARSLEKRLSAALNGLALAAPVLAACIPSPALTPRLPGDRCADECPDGMACFGTERLKSGKVTRPGRCDLVAGRCVVDGDCGRGQQCVRTSENIGLCAPSPRL